MKREEQARKIAESWARTQRHPLDVFEIFVAGFLAADAHPNWISVEDELPKENGRTQQSISVWATDGLIACEMRYNFDTKKWTDMWGDPFDVTHWMPLPALPEKGGDE